jgi:glyoxalase family protein
MDTLVTGIHHITLCPGSAQADVDFFTGVLGQRLVKQTVLLDGNIAVYHFYYGNAGAEPGSIATSFPYRRRKGRPGSGQVSMLTYAVPRGSLPFWAAHLAQHSALDGGIGERFGAAFVRARHPAGQLFELMEAEDARRPWTTATVCADVATRGFHAAVLSVREVTEAEQFFVDALGFRKVGVDGDYHRLALPAGGPASLIDLHHQPERAPGSWTFGEGTFHHIAFGVGNDEQLVHQKALYEELGYTDASEIKDRYYFHSMYVRAPGGILVECTASADEGFYIDETPEELGTHLTLPPWYEEQRQAIVSMLESVRLPEANQPRTPAAHGPRAPRTRHQTVPLSRTNAKFGGERVGAQAASARTPH